VVKECKAKLRDRSMEVSSANAEKEKLDKELKTIKKKSAILEKEVLCVCVCVGGWVWMCVCSLGDAKRFLFLV
jgi:hypothetical protein